MHHSFHNCFLKFSKFYFSSSNQYCSAMKESAYLFSILLLFLQGTSCSRSYVWKPEEWSKCFLPDQMQCGEGIRTRGKKIHFYILLSTFFHTPNPECRFSPYIFCFVSFQKLKIHPLSSNMGIFRTFFKSLRYIRYFKSYKIF